MAGSSVGSSVVSGSGDIWISGLLVGTGDAGVVPSSSSSPSFGAFVGLGVFVGFGGFGVFVGFGGFGVFGVLVAGTTTGEVVCGVFVALGTRVGFI